MTLVGVAVDADWCKCEWQLRMDKALEKYVRSKVSCVTMGLQWINCVWEIVSGFAPVMGFNKTDRLLRRWSLWREKFSVQPDANLEEKLTINGPCFSCRCLPNISFEVKVL